MQYLTLLFKDLDNLMCQILKELWLIRLEDRMNKHTLHSSKQYGYKKGTLHRDVC